MPVPLKAVMIGALFALGGCATALPPVQVTRFHLDQPIALGTVRIEPSSTDMSGDLEFQTYATAVQGELTRLGYAGAADASAYVAVLSIARDSREALARRSPVTVGVGGGTGGYGSGMGVGIGINLGGRPKGAVITELRVQLKRRGGDVVWEGRAQLEARQGAPAAQPGIAAGKLASALFWDFPGVSGRTISVR